MVPASLMRLLRWLPVVAAIGAGLLLLLAGLGVRAQLWDFGTGFNLLRATAYVGAGAAIGAALFMLIPPLRRKNVTTLLVAVVLGLGMAYVPWAWKQQAGSVPPIHDITTDTDNPPAFVDIAPLRAESPNGIAYGGPEVAAAQRKAYPDIGPLTLSVPPSDAWTRALEVVRQAGWEVVAADAATGRIEATDTTRWFGFKDDVVIRVSAAPGGSRIDIRSVSRVGRSDVGTNAKRIRDFLSRLTG